MLIGCGSLLLWAANLTPSQSASQFYLSGRAGGGDVGEKKQDIEIQRTEDLTCQVEPRKAHAQPNMISLGVNVLLIQGWLSIRRFQWIPCNYIIMCVALCKHHSNIWFDGLWLDSGLGSDSMIFRVFASYDSIPPPT